MQKNCKQCEQTFEITNQDQDFYHKIQVPEPKMCPKCRLIRRLQERNTRHLYYRKCDFTGEKIVSQYHENVTFPVYKPEIWWSDKWDATAYGQDFDFSRPFFEQFQELKNKVPHQGLYVISGTIENSDYTNCTGYLKNCYLIFESDYDEDCYYSNLLKNSKNLMDCSVCYNSELCYECIDCLNCYNLKYSQDAQNCQDSFFLKDCRGCKDCIGCINQRNKQYMIFNQQYSKEEYEKLKQSFHFDDLREVQKFQMKVQDFFATQFHKPLEQEHNENCLGDHLYNSKNSTFCFDSKDLEDCKYCVKVSLQVKSCMDYNSWGDKAELVYQSASCGDNIYGLKFCSTCTTNVSNSEYCDSCSRSNDLFGCVGVRNKQYCIFNKQYSKKEYAVLKARIIAHMKKTGEYGEFFPADACSFGYNETIAMAYFPLTREMALQQGYKWTEKEAFNRYQGVVVEVPDKLIDVSDDIIKNIFICGFSNDKSNSFGCGKNYRIISQELNFYRQMNVPVPKICPDCRYQERMNKRPRLALFMKKCAQCNIEIMTSFEPNGKEKVYCERCYLKEVY